MRRLLPAAIGLGLLVPAASVAQEGEEAPTLGTLFSPLSARREWGRGPLPIRDAMPLSSMRLLLHPFGPGVPKRDHPAGRIEVTWANTFLSADDSTVDAETVRAAIEVRDAVSDRMDVGLEVPIVWRGGGVLDGVSNFLHDVFGAPDGDRSDARDGRHEIAVFDGAGRSELDRDFGLGDLVLSSQARLHDGSPGSPAVALRGELRLPTASDDLGADGIDAGLALGLSKRVFDGVYAYAGGGGTHFFDTRHEGFEFEETRGYGFAALEWQALEGFSVLVQADLASPLLRSPRELDGWQSYVHVGGIVDLSESARLELAFVENVEDQDATADFALFAGVGVTF